MTTLTLYINNNYYSVKHFGSAIQAQNLNEYFPVLNNIIPKYISCNCVDTHVILDVDNKLHLLDYNTKPNSECYVGRITIDAFKTPIVGDPIAVMIDFDNASWVILLFSFDEMTNVFSVQSIDIWSHRGYYKECTGMQHINDIKSYKLVDSKIFLIGLSGNIYKFKNFCGEHFEIIYEKDHRDLGGSACLVTTGSVTKPNKTTKRRRINKRIIRRRAVPQFDDGINGNNLITHGITKPFVWTPNTHHYVSPSRRNIISVTIRCNKYTKYCRVPKFVLAIIINLFIDK